MKKYYWLLAIFFWACQSPEPQEFTRINSKVDFKYIQFGEGELPKTGDEILLNLVITDSKKDTLHYVPDYSYFFPIKKSSLDSAFMKMRAGDSACFKLKRNYFNKLYRFYGPAKSNEGDLLFYFRLKKVLSTQEADLEKKKLISKREIDEQAALRKYLKRFDGKMDTLDGIYRIINKRNPEGDSISYGSSVSIDYKGSFVDGYVFEDTYEKGLTPTFNYGKEYQLIDGMHIGLSGLREGESVKIILPSQRAFGSEGSLAGIVPPYTAVIFDVEIKKVIEKK